MRSRSFLIAMAAILPAVMACSDLEPGPSPASSVTVPGPAQGSTESLSAGDCEPAAPPPSEGPVSDPGGPYHHQVVVAHTTDGLRLSDDVQVLDHASVPDGVRLANGDVYIYYVNGEEHGVFVARLEGDVAVVLGPVVIDGVERPQGVVDPDATLLPDGTIRLVYFGSFGPPGTADRYVMCIADSSDGVNFTLRGQAIEFEKITTDPSITQLADGSWLMAASQGESSVLARSADGLRFAQDATLPYGGVPEVATLPGGDLRLYVCARAGPEVYRSSDAETWRHEGTVDRPPGRGMLMCDPSVVAGSDIFIYKTAE